MSVTRRDVCRGLVGAGAVLGAWGAPCALRHGLGLRTAAWGAGGKALPTARDYVQTGLISMWDGIENAGFGTHDASATVWKDLSGNGHDMTLKNRARFDDNSLVTADRNLLSADTGKTFDYSTIEIAANRDASRNASGLICFGSSVQRNRFLVWSASYIQFLNPYKESSDNLIASGKSSITCSYTGTGANSLRAFQNGNLLNRSSDTNSWSHIGDSLGLCGSSTYLSWNFVGNIYCLRLYGRALTEAEQMLNYAVDKARFGI